MDEVGQATGNSNAEGSKSPDCMGLDETDRRQGSGADLDQTLSSFPFKFVYQLPLLLPQFLKAQAGSKVLAPTATLPPWAC